jgi:hypothetical protein
MKAEALSAYIKNQAEKVNKVSIGAKLSFSMGFAIPVPEGTEQEDMKTVDKELVSLMWSFERVNIRGNEYYILFPFGR